VQCKQWNTQQVKVPVVREMWGLVSHHNADAVKIVCVGTFTADAEQFAKGKAIELINGEHLLELVRSVQSSPPIRSIEPALVPQSAAEPTCPRCGAAMFKRFNRQTSQIFWGCIKYPGCKGTRSV
jgi:restriction system protein